jgi:hypothetical protein
MPVRQITSSPAGSKVKDERSLESTVSVQVEDELNRGRNWVKRRRTKVHTGLQERKFKPSTIPQQIEIFSAQYEDRKIKTPMNLLTNDQKQVHAHPRINPRQRFPGNLLDLLPDPPLRLPLVCVSPPYEWISVHGRDTNNHDCVRG